MSIKQSISVLFFFLTVSFSTSASLVKVTSNPCQGNSIWGGFDCPAVGDVVDKSIWGEANIGKKIPTTNGSIFYITDAYCGTSYCRYNYGSSSNFRMFYHSSTSSCPDGKTVNPETGICEGNPCLDFEGEVTDSQSWNYFEHGSSPDICSNSCELKLTGISSCTVNSGICQGKFIYTGEQCNSGDGLTPGGTIPDALPDGCTDAYDGANLYSCPKDIDGDGYPDQGAEKDPDAVCSYDANDKFVCSGGSYGDDDNPIDPTDPVDPTEPSQPGTPPPSESKPVDPAPPVEDVPGNETSDIGVINAIKNQNEDFNNLLTSLNQDNNENFAEINTELQTLNAVATATNENIASQLAQDYEIYLAQKQQSETQANALLSAINTIGENDYSYFSSLGNTVSTSSQQNAQAITDGLDSLGSSNQQGFDAINQSISDGSQSTVDAITQLGEQLEGIVPCDPNSDDRSCEGQHGLTTDQIQTAFSQLDESNDSVLDTIEQVAVSAAQDAVDNPMTGETEVVINDSIDLFFDALVDPGDCVPFAMPSPFGGSVTIPCDFSETFKSVFSFLLYLYTLLTLIDILLNGVTPNSTSNIRTSRG